LKYKQVLAENANRAVYWNGVEGILPAINRRSCWRRQIKKCNEGERGNSNEMDAHAAGQTL
jgi:hypothetical protein